MINSADFQIRYNNIYKQIRKYIWDFDTVEKLVDFEISVYKAIPSLDEIRTCFYRLRDAVKDVESDDDDLKAEFDKFNKLIDDDQQIYKKIYQVDEVIPS